MKTAIMSDIHANPAALKLAVDDALAQGVGEFISLGDFVGYGPDPNGAIDMARRIFTASVQGNHDEAILRPAYAHNFNSTARRSVWQHEAELTIENREFIRGLPMVIDDGRALMFHGDCFVDDGEVQYGFGYICDNASAERCFAAMKAEEMSIAFVGHTHEPTIWSKTEDSPVVERQPESFVAEPGTLNIVNVGSVGCPRTVKYSSYVIIEPEDENLRIEFRRLDFDYIAYRKSLLEADVDVPLWLEDYVRRGGK